MIIVTGATGHLGKLVVEGLLQKVPAHQIVAAVRTPEKAAFLAARGVAVRQADYSRPESLTAAFKGGTKLLLISGNELGQREAQHKAVINAAKASGIGFLVYTSILHADTSPLALAVEHNATERFLQASGLGFALLRNGWYFENQIMGIESALQGGAFIGASGEGRFAAAARADYAAAAVAVLTEPGHENQIYELGGDIPYTKSEFAQEVSKQTGKAIQYHNLSAKEYTKALSRFLPIELAHVIADAEAKASAGALDDRSHTLSRLLGRNTTPLAEAVAEALKGVSSNK